VVCLVTLLPFSAMLCCAVHTVSRSAASFRPPLSMGNCTIMQTLGASLPSSSESNPMSRSCKWSSLATIEISSHLRGINYPSLLTCQSDRRVRDAVIHCTSLFVLITAQLSKGRFAHLSTGRMRHPSTHSGLHSRSVVCPGNRHTKGATTSHT
jgi:hypothetical protein